MVDLDSALQFGDFTPFIEANMGMLDSEIAIGALGKVNYAISDSYSVTGRFDYLTSPRRWLQRNERNRQHSLWWSTITSSAQ